MLGRRFDFCLFPVSVRREARGDLVMAITAPQQLNFEDRLAIRQNIVNRVAGIVNDYIQFIKGEATNTPNHANRLAWANGNATNITQLGVDLSWYALNNSSFLNGGSSIADSELQ